MIRRRRPILTNPDRLRSVVSAALETALPGITAQRAMAPSDRLTEAYDPNPPGARQSAVVVLITPNASGDLALVFIKRADREGPHSGQIAFPGGMYEPEDATLRDTALRECEEEVGVVLPTTSVLGSLSRLYIDVSRVSVLPFVAIVDTPPTFTPEPSEVDRVFLATLGELRASVGFTEIVRPGWRRKVPCYRLAAGALWGATAMITAELLSLIDKQEP